MVKQHSKALAGRGGQREEYTGLPMQGGGKNSVPVPLLEEQVSKHRQAIKRMEPLHSECLCVYTSVYLEINRRDDYMKEKKKMQVSPNRRLPVYPKVIALSRTEKAPSTKQLGNNSERPHTLTQFTFTRSQVKQRHRQGAWPLLQQMNIII